VRADLEGAGIILRAFAECLVSLRLSTKPTVAAVDGAALGGGVGIASACDLVIATPRSVFGLPELLLGLAPLLIWPLVIERVPPQKARLLALRGTSVPAAQACELGLVDSVVEPDALNRALNAWTRRLSRVRPDGVSALKRHMSQNLRANMLTGAGITATLLGTPSVQSMLCALEDGEAAPWVKE
jgi:enoyl-CoA hydratase/carnithine racemase